MKIAQEIIAELVRDMMGRCGLSDELDSFDESIKLEMFAKWEEIITKRFAILIEDKTQNEIAEEILADFYAPKAGDKPNSTLDPRYAKTEYVVEATSVEKESLWFKHHYKAWEVGNEKLSWEDDSFGLGVEVGKLNGMPICMSVQWATVNGMLVMFYHAMSRVVDHTMINDWLKENCNPQEGGRRAHHDAQNFHNVIIASRQKKEAANG